MPQLQFRKHISFDSSFIYIHSICETVSQSRHDRDGVNQSKSCIFLPSKVCSLLCTLLQASNCPNSDENCEYRYAHAGMGPSFHPKLTRKSVLTPIHILQEPQDGLDGLEQRQDVLYQRQPQLLLILAQSLISPRYSIGSISE